MQEVAQVNKGVDPIGIKHVIGYNTDFKNNIFLHHKDNQIIYPAANLIVVNNENKQQSFYQCHTGTNGISTMAQSKDKRYLAWSEQVINSQPIIVVLDLKTDKKKVFSTKDCKSSSYVCINFCPPSEGDGKIRYLIALSGQPEQMLFHFAIDKPRCIGFVNILKNTIEQQKFTHCFYHPKEEDFVVVLGQGQIKPYKLSQDQPRSLSSQPIKKDNKDMQHSQNYQAYCILQDGTMIIGTDQGDLLIFNNNCELKMILPDSPNKNSDNFTIECIIPYSKGFLVGGQDCTILIYEKAEGEHKKPYTRLTKQIQNKEYRYPVTSLLMADEKESNLIIGLENSQMLQVPFNSERVISEDNLKFEHQVLPFHSEKITGLDTCIRKTLVGTCSLDKTVRIWNYLEHTLENYKEFEEEAYALAFHPTGFHVIVAFRAKIRIMNLFEHDIIPFREIPAQDCQEIVFSNGGNLFAINNQSMVQIYNFYTGDQAYNINNSILRATGKVKAIFIEDDDLSIYTGNSEGQVRFWRLDDQQFNITLANQEKQQQTSDSQLKNILDKPGFEVSCISAIADTKQQGEYHRVVYIAGIHKDGIEDNEKCIYQVKIVLNLNSTKEIGEKKKQYIVHEPVKIFTESNISKVTLLNSGKLFFFGTNEEDKPGSIRAAHYYFDTREVQELQSHKKGITRLKATFDDNYLFSTSSDRSLIIYDVKDKDAKVRLDKDNIGYSFSEEFLMPQEAYNEQKSEIEQLLAERNEKEFKQKQMQAESQKKTSKEKERLKKLRAEVDRQEREKIKKLESQKKKMEEENEDKKKNLKQKHEQQKEDIEKEYNKKISMEETRNQELQEEVKREKVRFDTEENEIKEKHKRDMEDRERQFNKKREEYEHQIKELHDKSKFLDEKYAVESNNLEKAAEDLIESIKLENEEKMKELFKVLEINNTEKGAKSSLYEQEASKLEEERSKLKEILEQINTLTEQNKSNQKIKEGHVKEIQEREKTIKDKQKRIYELKKKTQELEKFKFVLDYKIKELKREIGPKEEEIAKMKEQIANMRSEIVHFRRNNANLSLIVTDLRLRQKGMRKEIEKLTDQEKQNANYINNYKQDVNDCHQELNDYKKLKQQCLKLYNKYVQEDNRKIFEGSNKQKDFIKERAHLETSVQGLKQKFTKNLNVHEGDNVRIMGQNVDLIREINDLKRERKNLKDEKKREQMQKNKQSVTQEAEQVQKQIDMLLQSKEQLHDLLEQISSENENLKNQQEMQNGQMIGQDGGQNQQQYMQEGDQQQYQEQYQQELQMQQQQYQEQLEQQQQQQQQNYDQEYQNNDQEQYQQQEQIQDNQNQQFEQEQQQEEQQEGQGNNEEEQQQQQQDVQQDQEQQQEQNQQQEEQEQDPEQQNQE